MAFKEISKESLVVLNRVLVNGYHSEAYLQYADKSQCFDIEVEATINPFRTGKLVTDSFKAIAGVLTIAWQSGDEMRYDSMGCYEHSKLIRQIAESIVDNPVIITNTDDAGVLYYELAAVSINYQIDPSGKIYNYSGAPLIEDGDLKRRLAQQIRKKHGFATE